MFYELYQALFSTINEDEAKQRVDNSANPPIAKSVNSASPAKKNSKIDLAEDIRKLEAIYGGHPLQEGFCIELSLQDLLKIIPRSRRRSDSYLSLQKALSGMGVTLKIISKKR